MTRMFALAALFFVGMIVSFIAGLAGSAPGLMMLAIFIFGPAFTFSLGFGLGRASNEFVLVRRERQNVVTPVRSVNGGQPRRAERREQLG